MSRDKGCAVHDRRYNIFHSHAFDGFIAMQVDAGKECLSQEMARKPRKLRK